MTTEKTPWELGVLVKVAKTMKTNSVKSPWPAVKVNAWGIPVEISIFINKE